MFFLTVEMDGSVWDISEYCVQNDMHFICHIYIYIKICLNYYVFTLHW